MSQKLKNKLMNFKNGIKKYFYDVYMEKQWKEANPYIGSSEEFNKIFDDAKPIIGILFDSAHEHQFYINACLDLKINYRVINIRTNDWITRIKECRCDIFLVWPTIYKPIQKQFWDERLQLITAELQKKIFPSFDLLWLYESKRKTRDWLLSNNLPHPDTNVFFDKVDALNFIIKCNYPIVCKTDQGATASGVFIIRNIHQARKMISKAFKRGILLKNRGINDRHQGYIIFQEYLPNTKEWRMIRVGDSYFCRLKGKMGDFHSGSGDIIWAKPPKHLLNKTKEISEKFAVPNINVDFFETENGQYLINEIHALWGGKVIHDAKLEGRYLYNVEDSTWSFEQGDYFQNRGANLRLDWIKNNWF